MTCIICCEPFTKSIRSKFTCPQKSCLFECCSKCVKTYIESNLNTPHCMSCKYAYDDIVIMKEINYTFYNNEYQSKMTNIIMDLERSLIASTIDEARQYKLKHDARLLLEQLTIEKNNIIAEIIYCGKYNVDPSRLNVLNELLLKNTQYSINPKSILKNTKSNIKKEFIMKCQHSQCKGYLSTLYKCNLCDLFTCPKCLVPILDGHVCNVDDIATASFIKQDTKSCPKCSQRIHKVDGCDQMWCTECNTAFSWNTGKLIIGTVHNPHYFEWMNKNGYPIAEECGMIPYFRYCYIRTQYEPHLIPILNTLTEIIRFTTEINENELNVPINPDTYKQFRIEYILDIINETEWKAKINKHRIKLNKENEHRQFMEVLYKITIDILQRHANVLKIETNIEKIESIIKQLIQEHTSIIQYINKQKIIRALIYKKGVKLLCKNNNNRIIITYKNFKRILEEENKIEMN